MMSRIIIIAATTTTVIGKDKQVLIQESIALPTRIRVIILPVDSKMKEIMQHNNIKNLINNSNNNNSKTSSLTTNRRIPTEEENPSPLGITQAKKRKFALLVKQNSRKCMISAFDSCMGMLTIRSA